VPVNRGKGAFLDILMKQKKKAKGGKDYKGDLRVEKRVDCHIVSRAPEMICGKKAAALVVGRREII